MSSLEAGHDDLLGLQPTVRQADLPKVAYESIPLKKA
jgi:hypothetical protein